jgi:hypothetical protein
MMKRTVAALAVLAVVATSGVALAVADEYDDSQSHPLRIVGYVVHPVGWALEQVIFRPFHKLVSFNETSEDIWGHAPHGADEPPYKPVTSSGGY